MFTEKVEQAKKELSPLMQEVRKYIPQAEYGYHVVSGEYPAFYGVRIEFTYNGIRFHVYKINKENKYRIATDMEHFEYVDKLLHADIQAGGAGKCGERPKGSRLLEKYRERTRKMGREKPFKRDDNPQRLALHFLHRGRTPLF